MIAIHASPTPIGSTVLNDEASSSLGPLAQMSDAPESAQNFAAMINSGLDLVRSCGTSIKALPADLAEESATPDGAATPIAVDPADTLTALQLILPGLLDQQADRANDQRLPTSSSLSSMGVRKATLDGMAALAQSDLFGSEAGGPEGQAAADDQFSAAALATRVQLWLAGHRSSVASEPTTQPAEIEPPVALVEQNRAVNPQAEHSETSDDGLPQRGQEGRVAVAQSQPEGEGMSFSVGGQSLGAMIGAPAEVPRPIAGSAITPRTLAHGLGTTTEWLDSLTRDIATASSGNQPLRFRVEPQNLGKIDVEVLNDAQRLSISLTASSPSALAALQDAQPRLLADVRTAGLHNAEAQIFASLAHRDGSRESGRGNNKPVQLDSRDTSESDEKTVTPRRRTGRLTDKFA